MTQPDQSPLPVDAEVLITIGANEDGLKFQVRSVGKPMDLTQQSHYFGKWLSDNCEWLMDQAMRLYATEKELAEARARSSLKLVGPDGERLN